MKLNNILIVALSSVFILLICACSVCATEDGNNLTADNHEELEISDETYNLQTNETSVGGGDASSSTNQTTTNTNQQTKTTKKTKAYGFCTDAFTQKSNKYFTVKVATFNEKKNKLEFHKDVKLIVKVKIGKNIKTFKVKTNSKGYAKILNVKNLKKGIYKVTVTSDDDRYSVKEKGAIVVYSKKTKTVTIKMNSAKKIKGDMIEAVKFSKNGLNKKGIYADSYNAKNPLDGIPHTFVSKVKFFFKNKKTGKVMSKTVKSKYNIYSSWSTPYHKLIKGYTPIKVKVWYSLYK